MVELSFGSSVKSLNLCAFGKQPLPQAGIATFPGWEPLNVALFGKEICAPFCADFALLAAICLVGQPYASWAAPGGADRLPFFIQSLHTRQDLKALLQGLQLSSLLTANKPQLLKPFFLMKMFHFWKQVAHH